MQIRFLGQSGLALPVVSFGAWAAGGWLWGGTDDTQTIRAIQTGIDAGITCIDTAPVYGMGHSETVVGQAIAGHRDQVILATKCGLRWDLETDQHHFSTVDNEGKPCELYRSLHPDSVRHECEQSLRRLGTDVIDLYQCHWPDPATPIDDTMGALLQLQQDGKIRAIGVSNFSPEQIQQGMKTVMIASDQPKYNALERGVEKTVLPFCRDHHIGVLAYSPIAQGLLTGKVTLDRVFDEGDARATKPLFSRENRQKILAMLDRVHPIAEAHNATIAQIFIAWIIAQPGLTSALVGARNDKQVLENARAGDITLTTEEAHRIRELVEGLGHLA